MGYYAGKKVLITGGSSGIGRAVALEVARRGAHVVVAARGAAQLTETVENMRSEVKDTEDRTFGHVVMDVTDDESVSKGIESTIVQQGGKIDVLICCSGFAKCGTSWDMPNEAYAGLMEVNYFGHVRVTRQVLAHMRKQKSGEILLVSSMLGFFSIYGYGAYSASKYALSGFAEALRQELLDEGVRVKLFYPPTTETPGLDLENEDKPDMVWAMESENSFTKSYTATSVAKAMVDCIPGGRFENMIGSDSWFVYYAYQLCPGLARFLADGEYRAAKKKLKANLKQS
eukprot:CAMPEP_0113557444 /NCGR_PEP_ID=MMETSP0015_2-20120614/17796_1 /TAXON_ID=2838 /ORGANISM="Odontella" /LENGTH=285 /DNA_ID=CAMNT_0000458873 /DNA_START=49 /DNA_END=906 /DNA_ORIENTATION=+ /assembly_acc=CAM_ASM_000160